MRKRTRLLLLLAVAVAGAGLAVGGVLPQGFASVTELAQGSPSFVGHEVHVKAIVAPGTLHRGAPVGFRITDGQASLPVEFAGSVPESFGEGRTVVVSGLLEQRASGPVLVASDIQGGCASKYEPSAQGRA